jgi:hypothetical protein
LTASARELHVFPPPLTDDWAVEVFHFATISAQAKFVKVHLNYDRMYTLTDYVECNARCMALLMRKGVRCEIVIKGPSDNDWTEGMRALLEGELDWLDVAGEWEVTTKVWVKK